MYTNNCHECLFIYTIDILVTLCLILSHRFSFLNFFLRPQLTTFRWYLLFGSSIDFIFYEIWYLFFTFFLISVFSTVFFYDEIHKDIHWFGSNRKKWQMLFTTMWSTMIIILALISCFSLALDSKFIERCSVGQFHVT